jgi:hypothetical protein
MSRDHRRSALPIYRDAVSERIEAGEPFGGLKHAIDTIGDLTEDQKAALWLFAFLRGDPLGSDRTPGPSSGASIRDKEPR